MFKTIAAPFRSKTCVENPYYDVSRTQYFLEEVENKLKLKSSVSLQTWTPSAASLEYISDMANKFKSGQQTSRKRPLEDVMTLPSSSSDLFLEGPTEEKRAFFTSIPQQEPEPPRRPEGEVFVNEEDERRHFLYQFAYMERLYPNEHMGNHRLREALPLDQLKNDYVMLSKRFDMDSRVEMFITCFIFCFMMMEKFSGLDGLCQHHMDNMPTYQRLMLKMNDKPLFKMIDKMSPEVVLIGVVGLQTALFWCNKRWFPGNDMLIKKVGGAIQAAAVKNVQ